MRLKRGKRIFRISQKLSELRTNCYSVHFKLTENQAFLALLITQIMSHYHLNNSVIFELQEIA